ncbi:heterokaryon incompatibility protein [Fusarium heterosporum]|uniref:Heterokaryon incompatibility protein n=1 Tax=Fusarium heterosporum TaxID=42747 RepID=A0A8H5TMR9_FUSHE|nr:heterokaryon incompatibility protein [Fusarium heterosporum]
MLKRFRESEHPIEFRLHDNSIGSVRGWGEPLVYAPDSPQRVRPGADMQLEYDWEATGDGPPQFRILTEVDDPKYAHDSISMRSAHQLCISCKDTFNYVCKYLENRKDGVRMKSNVIHMDNLASLPISAGLQRCFICKQIERKVQKMYPDLDSDQYSDYMIECCWSISGSLNEETKLWMVMYNTSMGKQPIYNYQHILRLGLWPKEHFDEYFDKKTKREEIVDLDQAMASCTINDTNDHADAKALALSWLERCMRNANGEHDVCNQGDKGYLPTRLLDVRCALEQGKVRLVCPINSPDAFPTGTEYASLSHCWGTWGSDENPKLLTANLPSRQSDGLDWKKLPKTFQDAFKIASWLNLDWLWIDSLCIIQDSDSDWQNEASMMDRVYMSAKINISADKGEDSRAGCFTERNEVDVTSLEFEAREIEKTWIVTTENTFAWMDSAPSLSRAWIHRERQLSKRIIHFTAKEMVWECCGLNKACFASETMPGGSPFDNIFNGETKFQIQLKDISDNRLSDEERLDKLHRLWNSTCQDLSDKSITYYGDFPIILSSLAREFHRLMPDDEYVAGLWRSTLAESLTWWLPGDKPRYLGYIAPSWSWLSAATPMQMYIPGHSQNKRALIETVAIDTQLDPSSSDPYGRLARGLSNGNAGIILSVVEEDQNGHDRLRLIGPDWNVEHGQTFRLTLDSPPIFPSDCRRRLVCLLLEETGSPNEYWRVGTLEDVSDSYSFKLRYQAAPDATIPEAGYLREDWIENPIGYTGQPLPGLVQDDSGSGDNNELDDIWDLLSEYVCKVRWPIIRNVKKEREREKDAEKACSEDSGASEGQEEEQHDGQSHSEASTTVNSSRESGDTQSTVNNETKAEADIAGEKMDDNANSAETIDNTSEREQVDPPNSKGDEASEEEEEEEEEEENEKDRKKDERYQDCMTLANVVYRTHENPSSGLTSWRAENDPNEAWRRSQYSVLFRSNTPAYGDEELSDLEEVLYQFDDVLDMWREKSGAAPWLQRLSVSEISLV